MTRPVVVVGGGIVGTAIAYRLQMENVETLLVERDLDPQGASAFSFASISAFDEPQSDVYLLKAHGMVGWRRWMRDFGNDLGARFSGEIRWAESGPAEDQLAVLLERAVRRGYPARAVSPREIARFEPGARSDRARVAVVAGDDGQVDAVRAIGVLREAFLAAGGSNAIGRATLMLDDQGVTVRVADDDIAASTVVLATGAETAALLDRLGWEVPMDPSPGLLAMTQPVEPFLNGTVYVYPEDGVALHLRQAADGRVLIGEGAQDEVARVPTREHATALLGRARRYFPALEPLEVDRFTVEWRPMPRDHMPIVGPLPGMPALYVATGHSGVTIAPALGEFVMQEVARQTEADRLKPFRPARFAARTMEAERNIEEVFGGSPELFIG